MIVVIELEECKWYSGRKFVNFVNMRWPTVNCVLLACIATTIATDTSERPKRDLQFWKDLITAKLGIGEAKPVQNEETIQILRIPGFENVVVKAMPKVTVVEAPAPIPSIQMDPTMALLQSYLGTQTPDQTLFALQNVKNILQSGILKAREEVVQVMPPQQQIIMLPPTVQEPRPIYPIYQRPMIPMMPQIQTALRPLPMFQPVPLLPPPPALTPHAPVWPPQSPPPALRPLPIPVLPPPTPVRVPVRPPWSIVPDIIVPQVKPLPLPFKPLVSLPKPPRLPLPTIPTKYSYKQVKADGSVTAYSSKDNHAVVLQETNMPLPPPPKYIMERFQKIIYGLPLGVSTISHLSPIPLPPIPFVRQKPQVRVSIAPVPIAPLYPEPYPIITRPSNVEVKVSPPNKKLYQGSIYAGSKVTKNPFNSAIFNEKVVVPKPVVIDLPVFVPPAPVFFETSELKGEKNPFSYKRIHGDGSISTFTSISTGKEHSSVIVTDEISKMPSPPSYIVDRIEEAAGKAHKHKSMWGYSFKIANGVGSYKNTNKDKIYYSRLESGAPKSGMQVLPDPLSSQDNYREKSTNKNVYYLESDEKGTKDNLSSKVDKDEFGNPFLSTKIKGEDDTSIELAGTKNEEVKSTTSLPDIQPVKKFPPLPTPILGENEKALYSDTDGAKYSYTLLNEGSSVKFEGKPNTPKEPIAISTAPLSGVDITKESDGGSGGFSYTQINNEGSVTTFTGDAKIKVQETMSHIKKVPLLPSAVVDVIQPLPKAPPTMAIRVNEKHPPGVLMFAEPAHSRYVYKQISHSNPRPFTVVQVEDRPRIEIPKGEVHVKVNTHHHVRPDGTRYPCSEVHINPEIPAAVPPAIGIPIAPIPPLPSAEVVTTMPSDFMYVPPMTAYAPSPISHRLEVVPHFSYTQVSQESGRKADFPKKRLDGSGFSYTQISKEGIVSTFTGDTKNKIQEIVSPIKKIPILPSAIVDVIQPLPKATPSIAIKVSEKRPSGIVMFAEQVPSRHVYKQIPHTNMKPFTVVKVADHQTIEVPKGEVKVKVNRHYHVRPDGTRYPCTEVHIDPAIPAAVPPAIGIPIAPIPPLSTAEVVSTMPSNDLYVPSTTANTPAPSKATVEVTPHFSYTQVTHNSVDKTSTVTNPVSESATTDEPVSFFSLNPIVVAPEESNYSYTQAHTDGSSVNVQGNKDNSVTINVGEVKSSANRGDIPDALA